MYIGIIGHMGHGKTSRVGAYLETHGFKRFHPAETIRGMLSVFLQDLGYSQPVTHQLLEGDLKRAPIPEFPNSTPTTLQQTLGTEWGRKLVSPEIWNHILNRRLDAEQARRGPAFKAYNDSIRFHDEARHVIRRRGILIKVTRPGFPVDLSHSSESHIGLLPYHFEVINKDSEPPSYVNNQLRIILEKIQSTRQEWLEVTYPGDPLQRKAEPEE